MSTGPDIRREEQIAAEQEEDRDSEMDWWLDYLSGPQAPADEGSEGTDTAA